MPTWLTPNALCTFCHTLFLGELSAICVIPLREDNRKSVPGFSRTPLCSSFPFPDFSLYLFTIINITMSITDILSSENPSSELLRLWGVLGTPDTPSTILYIFLLGQSNRFHYTSRIWGFFTIEESSRWEGDSLLTVSQTPFHPHLIFLHVLMSTHTFLFLFHLLRSPHPYSHLVFIHEPLLPSWSGAFSFWKISWNVEIIAFLARTLHVREAKWSNTVFLIRYLFQQTSVQTVYKPLISSLFFLVKIKFLYILYFIIYV